jgi:hypothetical protein
VERPGAVKIPPRERPPTSHQDLEVKLFGDAEDDMNLETDEDRCFPNVAEGDVIRLPADGHDFGTFFILARAEGDYLVARAEWPRGEWRSPLGPYSMEYGDSITGKQFEAIGLFDRARVREALLDYFRGGVRWRERHEWREV